MYGISIEIAIIVAAIMLTGLLHMQDKVREYLGQFQASKEAIEKYPRLSWWVVLMALWLISAALAAIVLRWPFVITIFLVIPTIAIGLFLDIEMVRWFERGFEIFGVPKPSGYLIGIGVGLYFLISSIIPASTTPAAAMMEFLLHNFSVAFCIGGICAASREQPPAPEKTHYREQEDVDT